MKKEDRINLMYAKLSRATAKGATFTGKLSDLFDGFHSREITSFLYAVSTRSECIPVKLFDVKRLGHGYRISRLQGGFVDKTSGEHIDHTKLTPFIVGAMKLYSPKKREPKQVKTKPSPVQNDSPKESCGIILDFTSYTDEDLTAAAFSIQKELDARAARRAAQAKLQTVLELAEMSKEELINLLDII